MDNLVSSVLSFQTLTPYMQSTAAKISDGSRGSNSRKTYGRRHSLGDQEQGNFSIELWKRAFKDACERLCPTRAGGHECGCLPVLSRLVCLCITISFLTVLCNAEFFTLHTSSLVISKLLAFCICMVIP